MTTMKLAMDPAGMVPFKQGVIDVTDVLSKCSQLCPAGLAKDESFYRDKLMLRLLERHGARAGVLFYTNRDGDMVVIEEYVR